jgi:SAM-dependent methyltransferase
VHNQVRKFIKEVRAEQPHKFRFRTVLEVGSHNINGSPRKYFWFCNYTGVDISRGKGVDIVGKFSSIEFDRKFQVVVSTGTLEHDNEWDITLKKMFELLEPGGLMIVTCAAPDHDEHGTCRTQTWHSPDTTDYYRNISTDDFKSVLPRELFANYVLMYARGMNDLQFYGIKKY